MNVLFAFDTGTMRSLGVLLLLARTLGKFGAAGCFRDYSSVKCYLLGVGFCQATRGYNCVIPSLCLDVVIDPRQGSAQVNYKKEKLTKA